MGNAQDAGRDFMQMIHPFLDGELSDDERRLFKAHAEENPQSAQLLKEYQQMLEQLGSLDKDVVAPLEFSASWRREIRRQAGAKRQKRFLRILSGAAAVLILWIGSTAVFRQQNPAPMGMLTAQNQSMEAGSEPIAMRSKGMELAEESSYEDWQFDEGESMASLYGAEDGIVPMQAPAAGGVPSDGGSQGAVAQSGVVILRSGNLTIETNAYDAHMEEIASIVDAAGGFFENKQTGGIPLEAGNKNSGRSAYLSIRVPEDQLDAVFESISQLGVVVSSQMMAEDITRQYGETEQRLKNAVLQRDRLRALLNEAEEMADIIAIEDKLGMLQNDIEWMQGTVNEWKGLADMARVYVSVEEVARKDEVLPFSQPLSTRIREGFFTSIAAMRNFSADMLVVLVMVLPQLLIWVPVLALLVWLGRIIVRKRRGRHTISE